MDSFSSSSSSSFGADFHGQMPPYSPHQVYGTPSPNQNPMVEMRSVSGFEANENQQQSYHQDFQQDNQQYLVPNQDYFYDEQGFVVQNEFPLQQNVQNYYEPNNGPFFYNQQYPGQMEQFVEQPREDFVELREEMKENNFGPVKGRRRAAKKQEKKASTLHVNSFCCNCGTRETKMWRRNERGEPECNSCNLYFRSKGVARPQHLWNKPTTQRRRRPAAQAHQQ